jgi:hypothetical protein
MHVKGGIERNGKKKLTMFGKRRLVTGSEQDSQGTNIHSEGTLIFRNFDLSGRTALTNAPTFSEPDPSTALVEYPERAKRTSRRHKREGR